MKCSSQTVEIFASNDEIKKEYTQCCGHLLNVICAAKTKRKVKVFHGRLDVISFVAVMISTLIAIIMGKITRTQNA